MIIKVRMSKDMNYNHYGVSKYGIVSLDMEEYLRYVVPNEMSDYYPAEALRAQAIAARTFAMYRVAISPRSSTYDIEDTTDDQSFEYGTQGPNATAAITYTNGKVMTSGGKVFKTFFHASNKGRTLAASAVYGNYPCQPAQDDPWSKSAGYSDHGGLVGMAQRGAQYAAANRGKTCTDILKFYYPGHTIATNYNSSGSGTGSGSAYSTWDAKYGNNTFVISNTYSGNVERFQKDMNKWRADRGYAAIGVDGKWGSQSEAATLLFQQAYSDLSDDGKAGPATKQKLYTLYGQYSD